MFGKFYINKGEMGQDFHMHHMDIF